MALIPRVQHGSCPLDIVIPSKLEEKGACPVTLHPFERAFPEAAPSDSAHISLVRTVSHGQSICKAVWEIQLLGTLLSLTKTGFC